MYQQDFPTIIMDGEQVKAESKFKDVTIEEEEEEISDIENYNEHYPKQIIKDEDAGSVFDSPEADSTKLFDEDDENKIITNEQNESTEVDRMLLIKQMSKKLLKRQRKKLSQKLINPDEGDLVNSIGKVVTEGRWVDVSDY